MTSLASEPFQHLLSGARASHGIKKGARVYFECQIFELYTDWNAKFIVGGSVLNHDSTDAGLTANRVIGPVEGTCGFDIFRGSCFMNGEKSTLENTPKHNEIFDYVSGVYGVFINRTDNGDGANSISLFKNGKRISHPQKLPESWNDQAIFPTVSFAGCGVLTNFGSAAPKLWSPPSFKVRTLQTSTVKDVAKSSVPSPGIVVKGRGKKADEGKIECMVHVGVPDQATYDYLDQMYTTDFAKYLEISDRAVAAWAKASEAKTFDKWNVPTEEKKAAAESSNDQPALFTGVAAIDNYAATKIMMNVAACLKRPVVIAGVEKNLQSVRRDEILSKFSASHFKKIAQVAIGEPDKAFVKLQEELTRAHLQRIKDKQISLKRVTVQRDRDTESKQREAKRKRIKAEREKKKAEEAKKKEEEAKEAKEGEEEVPEKDTEMAEPEQEEEDPLEGIPEPELKPIEEEVPSESVEVPEDIVWRTHKSAADCLPNKLSQSFAKFSCPTKEEGFDEIVNVFAKSNPAEYLSNWLRTQKLKHPTDIKPGDEFTEQFECFNQQVQQWREIAVKNNNILHTKHEDDAFRARREASEQKAAQAEEAQITLEVTRDNTDSTWGAIFEQRNERVIVRDVTAGSAMDNSGIVPGQIVISANGSTIASADAFENVAQDTTVTLVVRPASDDDDDLANLEATTYAQQISEVDVFKLEEIEKAVGTCPLYANFTEDDWKILRSRFQFHCMLNNFTKDITYTDKDHPGIHRRTLPHYFKTYFKRPFVPSEHGVHSVDGLLELLDDVMWVDSESGLIEAALDESTPPNVFVRLVEDARRERIVRLTHGDDTARLHFGPGTGYVGPPPSIGGGYVNRQDAPTPSSGYKGGYQGQNFNPNYQNNSSKGKGKGYGGKSKGKGIFFNDHYFNFNQIIFKRVFLSILVQTFHILSTISKTSHSLMSVCAFHTWKNISVTYLTLLFYAFLGR